MAKPLETWSIEEVGDWLDHLGLNSYQSVFAEKNMTGQSLLELKSSDLALMFYMHNPTHQTILIEAINSVKELDIHLPADFWEYKDRYLDYSMFLLFNIGRNPWLGIYYIYKYDTEAYGFYKQTVLTCNTSNVDETRSWWFYAGILIAPQFVNAKFALCFTDLQYLLGWFLFVHSIIRGILDLITLGSYLPRRLGHYLTDSFSSSMLLVLLVYLVSCVWWMVPTFLKKFIFYFEVYFVPFHCANQLYRKLFPRPN